MDTHAPYTAVAVDGPTRVGRRCLARPADAGDTTPPRFALYDTASDHPARPGLRGELIDRLEQRQRALALLQQADLLRALGDAEAPGWVRVVHRETDGGVLVTSFTPRSAADLIATHTRLLPEQLTTLTRQVLRALGAAERHLGRGHGDLRPETIRLTDRGDVLLAEPRPGPATAAPLTGDLRALGAVLYQLVTHEPYQARVAWPIERTAAWRRLGRAGEPWRRLVIHLLDPATPPADLTPNNVLARVPRPPSTRAPRAAGIAAVLVLLVGGFVGSAWLVPWHPLRPLLVAWSPTEFDPQTWRQLALADEAWLAALYTAHGRGELAAWERRGLAPALEALDDIAQQRQAVDPEGGYSHITRAIAKSQATPAALADAPTPAAMEPRGYTATHWTWEAATKLATAIRDAPLRQQIAASAEDWAFLDGAGPHGHLQRMLAVLAMPIDDPAAMRELAVDLPPDQAVSAAIAWTAAAPQLQPLARELRQAVAADTDTTDPLVARFAQVLRSVLDADARSLGDGYVRAVQQRAALTLDVARQMAAYQQRQREATETLGELPETVLEHSAVQAYRQAGQEQATALAVAMAALEGEIPYITSNDRLASALARLQEPLAAALAQPTLAAVLARPPDIADPRFAVPARLDALADRLERMRQAGRFADAATADVMQPGVVDLRRRAADLAGLSWTLRRQGEITDAVAAITAEADALDARMLLDESRWLARGVAENLPILESAQAPEAPRLRGQFDAQQQRLGRFDGATEPAAQLAVLRTLHADLSELYQAVRPELALGRLATAVGEELARAAAQGAAVSDALAQLAAVQRQLAPREDQRMSAQAVRDVRTRLDDLLQQALRGQPRALPDEPVPAVDRFWQQQRDQLLAEVRDVTTLIAAADRLRGGLAEFASQFPAYDPQMTAPPGWQHDAIARIVAGRRDSALQQALSGASADALGRFEPGSAADAARSRYLAARDELKQAAATLVRIGDHLARFTGLDHDPPQGEPDTATLVEQMRGVPGFAELRPHTGPVLDQVEQIEAIASRSLADLQALVEQADAPAAVRLTAWRQLGARLDWPASPEQFAAELAAQAALRDGLAAAALAEPRRLRLQQELTDAATTRWQRYATSGDAARFEAAAQQVTALGIDRAALSPAVRFDLQLLDLRRDLLALGEQPGATPAIAAVRRFEQAVPAELGGDLRQRLQQQISDSQGDVARPRGGPNTVSVAGVTWTPLPADDDTTAAFTWPGVNHGPHTLRFVRIEDRGRGVAAVMLQDTEFTLGLLLDLAEAARAQAVLEPLLPDPFRKPGPVGWHKAQSGEGFALARSPAAWISRDDQLFTDPRLAFDLYVGDTPVPPPAADFPMNFASPEAAAALAGLVGCRLPTDREWQAALRQVTGGRPLPDHVLAAQPRPNLRDARWSRHFQQLEQSIAALRPADRVSFESLFAVLRDQSFGYPFAGDSAQPAAAWPGRYDDQVLWLAPGGGDADRPLQHLVGNLAELVYLGEPVTLSPADVLALPAGAAGNAGPLAAVRRQIRRDQPGQLGLIGASFASPPPPAHDPALATPLPRAPRGFAGPLPEGWPDVGFRLAYPAPNRSLQSQLLALLDAEGYTSLNP